MAERLQVGDQLDVALATRGIQRQHVVGGERIATRADVRVTRKIERVLDVELELVVLVRRQAVHQLDQRGQCWHFATRDIEHDSAMGHRRAIADVQRRDTAATRPQELLERLDAVEQARLPS